MQWFGDPWPSAERRAPVCEDDKDRVPLPPGELCGMCGNLIEEGSQGVVMPHQSFSDIMPGMVVTEIRYHHLDCILRNVGVWQEPETGPGKAIRL